MFEHPEKKPTRRALITSAALSALVLAGVPTPAVAQEDVATPAAEEEAEEIVECTSYVPPEHRNDPNRLALRGVACFEAGEYTTALGHYREAHAISGAPFLLGAMGRAMQELGYPDLARHYYRAYLDAAPTGSEGRQRIEQRLEVMEQRLSDEGVAVTVASAPPRSRIYLILDEEHWEDVGESPVTLELTPGTHELAVEKAEHLTSRQKVTVEAGQPPQRVEVEVVPESATFHSTSRSFRRAGAYTMFASLPILVGGATLIFMAIDETDDAENFGKFEEPKSPEVEKRHLEALDNADDLERWGFITAGVGTAVLVTGGVLYFIGVNEAPEADAKAGASVRPYIGPRNVGLSLTW